MYFKKSNDIKPKIIKFVKQSKLRVHIKGFTHPSRNFRNIYLKNLFAFFFDCLSERRTELVEANFLTRPNSNPH